MDGWMYALQRIREWKKTLERNKVGKENIPLTLKILWSGLIGKMQFRSGEKKTFEIIRIFK